MVTASLPLFAKEESEEFHKAAAAFQEKDFDTAIKGFKKVSEKNFGHEPSFYNLGLSYFHIFEYDRSLKAFNEALKYNPYNLITAKFITDLYIIQKDFAAAEEKIKEIIVRSPQDIDNHLKSGLLAIKRNDAEKAAEEFIFIHNLNPKDSVSRLNLAALFIQKEDTQKAKTFLSEVGGKGLGDKKLEAFCWAIQASLHKFFKEEKKSQEAASIAAALDPKWKALTEAGASLAKLQLELADYLLVAYSVDDLLAATPADFEQSEVSKRLASRLRKEEEEAAKKGISVSAVASAKKPIKMPFGISGELNQTFENYDRNPATSSPINDVNTLTNLKLEKKVKDISAKTEFEGYYNRWDHTDLDYFKVNVKDNKNDEADIGKFSAKNFPELVAHPSIEQGGRWWHSFQIGEKPAAFEELPENFENFSAKIPSLAEIYQRNTDHRLFKTWELTVLRGRSKEPRNLNRPKLKNDRTYETSGQFEQWVNAVHLMTKPTSITEMGISYSRVRDDELSATVSSTTYPLESEAAGIDGKIDFLDGKLKTDGEFAWSNYDDNVHSEVKNKRDVASTFGLSFKYIPDWELSYDLKRVGTNFKVEGAYQTQDKITQTLVTKYSAPKNIPWRIRSIDVKYEPARTNLPKSGPDTVFYKTLQPKISFNLPKDAKISFDYKWYFEDHSCKCTFYRTQTLKTEFEYECKPIKTTFKPSFTFERKDDRVASPTDEKQKDYAITIENKSVNNLTVKAAYERDRKNYVGANTKAYDNKKFSLETEYAFIPNRFTTSFKGSSDDKAQTDTNNIILNTFDWTFNFTSKDGNKKMALEYERKLNIYKPWSETSAYKQNYAKMKYTQKF